MIELCYSSAPDDDEDIDPDLMCNLPANHDGDLHMVIDGEGGKTIAEWPVAKVSTHGYVCKSCGGPSPVGVGYASNQPGAAEASAQRTQCACGYSIGLTQP